MDVKPLSFEDTAVAFSYKSDSQLRKANFIFSLVNHPWVSAMATSMLKLALNLRLPIKSIIRKTAFEHFCGGETIEESKKAIDQLAAFRIGTILDYSVEGEKNESGFETTTREIIRTIENAKGDSRLPFSVFKVTGLGSFDLLEKVQRKDSLTDSEKQAFDRVRSRVEAICGKAFESNVPVLVDAEETWIQEPIDAFALEMMAKFNRQSAIVFNTYQLYRTDTLANLKADYQKAIAGGFILGAKLVRGAYMEKERARAEAMGYPSPIQPTKEDSDKAFNEALLFSVEHLDRISFMCGSHNEFSNRYLTELMRKHKLADDDKRVWFAQLYGMSDNISFNLARSRYNVAKYVPYGPVSAVMPYLLRRAAENTSVAGQSSRELILIRRELKRRRSAR